jgi:hypothetical protein
VRMRPVKIRTIVSGTRRSQCEDIEWRCLSLREARMLAGKAGKEVIGSSGASAGLNCTASLLREQMVPLCAVQVAHGIDVWSERLELLEDSV